MDNEVLLELLKSFFLSILNCDRTCTNLAQIIDILISVKQSKAHKNHSKLALKQETVDDSVDAPQSMTPNVWECYMNNLRGCGKFEASIF